LFRTYDAYLIPTILAGVTVSEYAADPQSFLADNIRDKASRVGPISLGNARRAHAAGVKLAFGTDVGIVPYGRSIREFELLVEAGLTPAQAIATATTHGAKNLGLEHEIGTLNVGKRADLVALSANPLEDIGALHKVVLVMSAGEVAN
jgi:imidazolonepropionase-like amidohydrolase